jgi:hypothetical protein
MYYKRMIDHVKSRCPGGVDLGRGGDVSGPQVPVTFHIRYRDRNFKRIFQMKPKPLILGPRENKNQTPVELEIIIRKPRCTSTVSETRDRTSSADRGLPTMYKQMNRLNKIIFCMEIVLWYSNSVSGNL